MSFLPEFGNRVEGYDQPVINEREARAAAGLLFAFGFLSFLNSFMLGNFVFTQYFVTFFMVDFAIRMINPNYSPSMLLGRVFVQNQVPEYVGATQKRFAWSIGLILSIFMFYLVVVDPQMNPIKIVICTLCLIFLFAESAFSICIGCKLYNTITKKQAENCPGGICEIREKEPIQTFNTYQKSIVAAATVFTIVSLYLFSVNTPNNSTALKMMPMMLMSDEERMEMHAKKIEQQLEAEFEKDDFDDEDEEESTREMPTQIQNTMKCAAGRCGGGN